MGEANFYYFTCLNFAEVVLKSIIVIIEEVVETPPPTPPSHRHHNHHSKISNSQGVTATTTATTPLYERRFGSYEWDEDLALACDNYRSPFVLWAQDADNILLKIDIKDARNPRIKIGEHSVDVLTEATGASGVTIYRAHIDLLHNVHEKESSFMVLSNHIDIKLSKYSKNDWWS